VKRAPYYSDKKKDEILQAASLLYRNHFTGVSPLLIFIMDDDSYVLPTMAIEI
jgi:hypothetical protein